MSGIAWLRSGQCSRHSFLISRAWRELIAGNRWCSVWNPKFSVSMSTIFGTVTDRPVISGSVIGIIGLSEWFLRIYAIVIAFAIMWGTRNANSHGTNPMATSSPPHSATYSAVSTYASTADPPLAYLNFLMLCV